PVDPAPRPLRHALEEAPFASGGEGAVPDAEGVDAAGRHGRHVRTRGTYGIGERLLLRVDEGLGCRVERDARGDGILGAVHPVTGRQVETDVIVVGRQRLRAVALGERTAPGAEDRLVDRTAAE